MSTMNKAKTAVNVVFGAMTFGPEVGMQSNVHDIKMASAIIEAFQRHGHYEIDTASNYSDGGSESMLAELEWKQHWLQVATKYYPSGHWNGDTSPLVRSTEEGMRAMLERSLKNLKTEQLDLWYLHGPDRVTPIEVTMRAVDKLFKEGKFKRFGVSNWQAWEVARACEVCRANGWKQPDVYQGVYNALHRAVEPELFPCLRYYGIAFYNFNPLAGGYLTSRYQRDTKEVQARARFDPEMLQGRAYRQRYWHDQYFDALELLRPVAKKHGLSEVECALRWMQHHSQLKREFGDACIVGASSVKHIEENLVDFEKGPLPEDVLEALDKGWEGVRGLSFKYWH